MKIHFNRVFIITMSATMLSGCGVLFATGNWWNNDYPDFEEQWVHPTLNKNDAKKVSVQCSDMAKEKTTGIKNFSKLTRSEQDDLSKKTTHDQYQIYFSLQEQCFLDHGFKFYPRGIKRDHPTVCFGEAKKLPGCQSVFDIPIL